MCVCAENEVEGDAAACTRGASRIATGLGDSTSSLAVNENGENMAGEEEEEYVATSVELSVGTSFSVVKPRHQRLLVDGGEAGGVDGCILFLKELPVLTMLGTFWTLMSDLNIGQ